MVMSRKRLLKEKRNQLATDVRILETYGDWIRTALIPLVCSHCTCPNPGIIPITSDGSFCPYFKCKEVTKC